MASTPGCGCVLVTRSRERERYRYSSYTCWGDALRKKAQGSVV